ncbi:MAG: hypothetical protein KTR20_09925 [Cellvibrionaceae bacterium]|nr:hypothetical protein [Cellvibrionaceae bacterium]
MLKFFFALSLGFVIGAVVIENKAYFMNTIALPVAFLPDGGEYEGDVHKGALSGTGRIVWPDGSHYEGEFKAGLYHGRGRYQTDDFIYTGDFVRGAATGVGTIRFADGAEYEGEVVDARAQGTGVMTLAQGQYQGEFFNNRFHGQGRWTATNGDRYEGAFSQGFYHGDGVFVSADGETYRGEFVEGSLQGVGEYHSEDSHYKGHFEQGLFHGQGEYRNIQERYSGEFVQGQYQGVGDYADSDGVTYQGEFVDGRFHGSGVLQFANGERYEGEFEYGIQHGQGVLRYVQPVEGLERVQGRWEYGQLVDSDRPEVEHDARVIVEEVLYHQHKRLDAALSQLAEQTPGVIDLYFVGIAGDGFQGVFRREVNQVKSWFDEHYFTQNRSLALINSNVSYAELPLATVTSIQTALQAVAAKMDPEEDILFLFFTSHGSPDFQFQLSQPGLALMPLSADAMGDMIHALPVRHKVVVVSACFAGGYVQPVKDDHTLVIVASAADKTSFGCSDSNEMTYFGEAFFNDALPGANSFVEAFERAQDIVRGREAKEGYEHSNPLIFKPKAIQTYLAQWRQQLAQMYTQQALQID